MNRNVAAEQFVVKIFVETTILLRSCKTAVIASEIGNRRKTWTRNMKKGKKQYMT